MLSFTGNEVFASNLPACPPSGYENHNCFGTYVSSGGSKYVGEWKDNKMHGQGSYTMSNGGTYIGGFKADKWHGHGAWTAVKKFKYVGEWKDSKRHGQGTLYQYDGETYRTILQEGVWKNNEFQYTQKLNPPIKKTPSNSTTIATALTKDIEILDLRLRCKTKPGTIMNKDSSISQMPEQEVFITLKLFDLAEPFQTDGVAKFQITQKASISIEGNAFYTTHEMVGHVGDATKPNLITIDEEKFSFINAQSKYSPGNWMINIDRITGLLGVMGMSTSSMVQMVTYDGKCTKMKNKKMF